MTGHQIREILNGEKPIPTGQASAFRKLDGYISESSRHEFLASLRGLPRAQVVKTAAKLHSEAQMERRQRLLVEYKALSAGKDRLAFRNRHKADLETAIRELAE